MNPNEQTAPARRRNYIAIAFVLALIGAGAVWYRSSHRRDSLEVVHRFDGPHALQFIGAGIPKKIRLGESTRTAVVAPRKGSLEVDVAPGVNRLTVSMGLRGAETSEEAIFTVSGLTAEGWKQIFSDKVRAPMDDWADRTVDFGELAISRLRLEAGPAGAKMSDQAEALWGSLLVSRPRVIPEKASAAKGGATATARPLSVILISLDTLGAGHIGSFGGPAGVSPNMDRIFAESFVFKAAYAQYPNTPVSHASLFSGRYPIHHGVYETSPWFRPEEQPAIAGVFADNGYVTAAITEDAFISSDFGFDAGFDQYANGAFSMKTADDISLGNSETTFGRAKKWLEVNGREQPFLLFVHTYEVHTPYHPKTPEDLAFANLVDPGYEGPYTLRFPGGFDELGNNSGRRPLSPQAFKRLAALYAGEIHYLDRVVADFFQFLEQWAPDNPPLVIIFADHGEEFGEHGKLGHGETLYSPALHVPLVFHQPGAIQGGSSAAGVQLVDVFPTLLNLTGLSAPGQHDGVDLTPILTGAVAGDVKRPTYAELKTAWGDCRKMHLPETCEVNRLAVRAGRFKLITSEIPPSKMLFDLEADPGETVDVSQQFPAEKEALEALLAAYHSGAPISSEPSSGVREYEVDESTRERLRALGYLE